jgi:hypothetical protein
MANIYPAFTAYLSPSLTPATFNDDVAEELLSASTMAGELPIICTSSRNGAINADVRRMASALGLGNLSFLYGEPWNAPTRRCAWLLRTEDLQKVERDIATFFGEAATSPDVFARWLGSRTNAIEEALERAKPAVPPEFHDIELGAIQLFSYLKTLAHYCEYALARRGALVHVQWGDS